MSRRSYHDSLHLLDRPTPDWRWTRAGWLASGDPAAGRYTDDAVTLLAVKVRLGEQGPDLNDVSKARAVYQAGGLPKRPLQTYLLTALTEAEIGGLAGMSEGAVAAYAALFFAVRDNNRVTPWVRAEAEASADPLVRAARYGHLAVQVRLGMETGQVTPEWVPVAESFELWEVMDQLVATDLVAYLRAVERLRRIDGG